MKTTIIVLLLAFGMRAQTSTQTQPQWMEDLSNSTEKNKAAHYWASFGGTIVFSEIFYHYTERPGLSPILGGLLMFAVGMLKEDVWDGKMHMGVKSGGDKFMDGMGCAGGMMAGRVVIHIREKRREEAVNPFN